MAVYKQSKSKYWWYKFIWNGDAIRKTTKQTNKRVAEQMEAAHRTALARGEVGIREKKPVPTLKEFAEHKFLPHICATFAAKVKTRAYYQNGVRSLLAFEGLAEARLDAINGERISEYVRKRQRAKGKKGQELQVSSLNRELQVLRRIFHLAQEWGIVEKALPVVKMQPGEKHRERVLTIAEEDLYFRGASSEAMMQYSDPCLLRNVTTILLDCGLRPEECFRLRVESVADGKLEVLFGKTRNARRRIPMTPRVKTLIEMISKTGGNVWVFPAQTKSGHIEPSSLKKQHLRAVGEATRIAQEQGGPELAFFELYTLRHTCLTRWAPHMDPWTLAYLAGHVNMNTTKRYVHPQEKTVRDAMERAAEAQRGHTFRHTQVTGSAGSPSQVSVPN